MVYVVTFLIGFFIAATVYYTAVAIMLAFQNADQEIADEFEDTVSFVPGDWYHLIPTGAAPSRAVGSQDGGNTVLGQHFALNANLDVASFDHERGEYILPES